jgi:hypothetical protein
MFPFERIQLITIDTHVFHQTLNFSELRNFEELTHKV